MDKGVIEEILFIVGGIVIAILILVLGFCLLRFRGYDSREIWGTVKSVGLPIAIGCAVVLSIIMIGIFASTSDNDNNDGCNNCGRTPVNYRGYCDRCWEHIVDGLEDHYNDD